MPERRPNRTLGGVHDEFWRFCDQRELRLQQCGNCATFAWPPVEKCELCGDTQLEWQPVTGSGALVSWATFDYPYHQELPLPWDTILVELEEGPLFVSNPLGFPRDDMEPRMPVRVDFLECEDDAGPFLLPVFRRAL